MLSTTYFVVKHRFFRRWLLWNLVQFHVTSSVISRKSGSLLIFFLHFIILLMKTYFCDADPGTLYLVLVSLLISYKLLYFVSIVLDHPLVHGFEDLFTLETLLLCEALLWRGLFLHDLNVCFHRREDSLRKWVLLFYVMLVILTWFLGKWIVKIYL